VGLDAEAVQLEPGDGEVGDQGGDVAAGLPAADRPEPDQGFGGQVDPGPLVQVGAAAVVVSGLALQHRHDRQVRGEGA
jgi:hypothetical protein